MEVALHRSSPLPQRTASLQKSQSATQLSRTSDKWGGSPTRNGHTDPFRVTASRVPVPAVKGGIRPRSLSPMAMLLPKQRPMFTGRMVMQGYWGLGPPKAGVFRKKIPTGAFDKNHIFEANLQPATEFRRFYERGDIPICVRHGANPTVEWKVEPERLDYGHYLPIFFDGLLEKAEPYNFLAYQGLQDMLHAARGKEPSVLLPLVPQLIVPIKRALNTKDNEIVCRCINTIQLLVKSDERVGDAMVPYYRQILPVFNLFRSNNLNLGDGIEYSQRKRENMGDLIQETLELFEKTGGSDAFINIKYMIPTYESASQ